MVNTDLNEIIGFLLHKKFKYWDQLQKLDEREPKFLKYSFYLQFYPNYPVIDQYD